MLQYGVAVKRTREWRGKKKDLEELKTRPHGAKRFRLEAAGGKPLSPEMEENLLEWIYGRLSKVCISQEN